MQAKVGSKGDLVQEIQSKLVEYGFDPGPIDGVFGEKTKSAVVEFQKSKELKTDGVVGPVTMKELDIQDELFLPEPERRNYRSLLLENPNYFGTFPGLDLKPVKPMQGNTKYEEIRCIGFRPEEDLLEAVIDVKLPYGYKGNLCSPGSYEYVRFFVDWNDDGDFTDANDDVGIASVNVHDIPNTTAPCLTKTKPMSYSLRVRLDPKRKRCHIPYLVKVRAILSWDVPPPAGNPDYPPIWGNVLEAWIQIKPTTLFLADIIKVAELEKLKIEPSMLDLELPVSKAKTLTKVELKELYEDQDVPEHRYNFQEFNLSIEKLKQDPNLMAEYKADPKFSAFVEVVDQILAGKWDTRYEELHCIGLNYNLDQLVGTLTVKLPYGYSGNLCADGSHEYVAFWAYVRDQIEQRCSWRYLGTASVNVHDISTIPPEGLQYAVRLPVDLSDFKDKCSKPKLLKIRGILSWNTPPPISNPYYNPIWGNRLDRLIQIKPAVVKPGEQRPFVWAVGNMAVESISGNPYTVTPSSIGNGYANGPSLGEGFSALESPFGRNVRISGSISHAPNNPSEANKLRYKVQYKKVGSPIWRDITDKFRIWIRVDDVPSGYIDQVADGAGYFKYQKDLEQTKIVEVQDDVMAIWHTQGISDGDGLYEIRVLLHESGAMEPGCPPDHVCSGRIKVVIDNTRPEAEVTLDSGPCEQFTPGKVIKGEFEATDKHFWKYAFSVLPYKPPVNSQFKHTPVPALNYVYGQVPTYKTPGIPASGITNGKFELDTKGMKPCGYVVHLEVWDRAIVNNHMNGNKQTASVGFCLLKKE